MTVWNRFEQYFKRHGMRALERVLGLRPLSLEEFDPKKVDRILVIRPHDQLGDFLLATPVFRALRIHFPKARIVVVARSYTATLIKNNQYIDAVIPFYESGYTWTFNTAINFIRAIRSGFDLSIVLNTISHSLTSDLIAYFSRARYVLGPDHDHFPGTERNFFYNLLAPSHQRSRHQTERNLDIVRYINVTTDDLSENIFLTPDEIAWANRTLVDRGLGEKPGVLFVHPGAGKIENRWPAVNFASVTNWLVKKFGLGVALSWGANEASLGEEVREHLQCPAITFPNVSLRQLSALISVSKLFLCNDTGVMHLGAAVSTPLVAIFGPTDPTGWKPIGEKFVAIRGSGGRCEAVPVTKVIEAAKGLIEKYG